MEETGARQATPTGAPRDPARPVLHEEMEFRANLEEFRPRMIQWAREVEKPLGEVGDLRAAYAHLRHLLAVANGASLVEELVLFVEYQGARRILHVPVANRIKVHLKEIAKLGDESERLRLSLAQMYLGYVARLAKIAQSQRGNKPVQSPPQRGQSKGPQASQGQQAQGQQGGRPRGGQPGGGPHDGKGRPGRGPRPESKGTTALAAEPKPEAKVEAAPAMPTQTPAPEVLPQPTAIQAEAASPAAEPAEAQAPAAEPVSESTPDQAPITPAPGPDADQKEP